VVQYAIDPHGAREITPPVAAELLLSIPVIMWGNGFFGFFLYW
jgi:hypothetical protein